MADAAMLVAIFERKMRPASCTWPMAKGIADSAMKHTWCTAEEKHTSLARQGMSGAYSGSRKIAAAYPYIDGRAMIVLMMPYTTACDALVEEEEEGVEEEEEEEEEEVLEEDEGEEEEDDDEFDEFENDSAAAAPS